jgi:hypothetical protein
MSTFDDIVFLLYARPIIRDAFPGAETTEDQTFFFCRVDTKTCSRFSCLMIIGLFMRSGLLYAMNGS